MKGTKTGGRKKGIPNKITKDLKEKIKSILDTEIENIPAYLSELEAKEKLEILIKLLQYVVPKPAPITNDTESPAENYVLRLD